MNTLPDIGDIVRSLDDRYSYVVTGVNPNAILGDRIDIAELKADPADGSYLLRGIGVPLESMQETSLKIPRGVGVFMNNGRGCWVTSYLDKSNPWYGYTITPGGCVNDGENDYRAAHRELEEETGCAIRPQTRVHTAVLRKPDGSACVSSHFSVETTKVPVNLEPHKHADFIFMTWDDLRKMKLMAGTRAALSILIDS